MNSGIFINQANRCIAPQVADLTPRVAWNVALGNTIRHPDESVGRSRYHNQTAPEARARLLELA